MDHALFNLIYPMQIHELVQLLQLAAVSEMYSTDLDRFCEGAASILNARSRREGDQELRGKQLASTIRTGRVSHAKLFTLKDNTAELEGLLYSAAPVICECLFCHGQLRQDKWSFTPFFYPYADKGQQGLLFEKVATVTAALCRRLKDDPALRSPTAGLQQVRRAV